MAFGIREKILAAFVVLSLVPLLTLGSIAGYQMNTVGNRSVSDSTHALSAQAELHLIRIAGDKAAYSNEFFVNIMNDAEELQAYANDVFTNREKFGAPAYPAYKYPSNLALNLPAYGYKNTASGAIAGAWADWEGKLVSSPYLNRSVVARAEAEPVYGAWVSAEMNSTMLLDKVLKPVYDRNTPNVVATWFVRSGGISISYQLPRLDWASLLNGGQKTPDWNESYKSYYQAATPSNDPKREPVWIDPYYDTVGNGWIISCVAPVYRGMEFIGVIGIDVTLEVVVNAVLDVKFFDTGHAFLVDKQENAIAHKDLVAAMGTSKGDPVPITALETNSPSFRSALRNMTQGQNDIEKFTSAQGKKFYIAYAPVPSPGFSLGVVIPIEEVTAPVRATEGEISAYTSNTLMIFIAVMVVAIVVAVAVGAAIATQIVKPIKRLTDLAGKIGTGEIDERVFTSGALDVDDELTKRPDEIGDLAKSFEDMLNTLREDIKKTPKSEIKIEIKDSVISRSFGDMGTATTTDGQPVNTKAAVKKELEDSLKKDADMGAVDETVEMSDGDGTAEEPVDKKTVTLDGGIVARGKVAQDATPAEPSISICPYCGKGLKFKKTPKFCPYCKEEL